MLVCQRELGTNRKLSTLAQMLPAARHEILLVNDSDIRVASDYLLRVIAPLADSAVIGAATGVITCTVISNLVKDSDAGLTTCDTKAYVAFAGGGFALGAVVGWLIR